MKICGYAGCTGDDEEEDLCDVPVPPAKDDENGDKRAHPSTLTVWLDFEKLFKVIIGKMLGM